MQLLFNKDIILRPELYSPPHFRIQGGGTPKRDTRGWTEILLSNIEWLSFFICPCCLTQCSQCTSHNSPFVVRAGRLELVPSRPRRLLAEESE